MGTRCAFFCAKEHAGRGVRGGEGGREAKGHNRGSLHSYSELTLSVGSRIRLI